MATAAEDECAVAVLDATNPADRFPSLETTGSNNSRRSSTSSDHSVLVSIVGAEGRTAAEQQSASTAAAAAAAPSTTEDASGHTHQHLAPRGWRWRVVNYVLIPACLPLLAAYWLLALLAGLAAAWMVWPSLQLARRLYWACPFIPYIWTSPAIRGRFGTLGSWLLRLQFEGAHCATVVSRLLTLPLRPHLPDFYLLGFPKCGTTSMASYLQAHPGISGLAGMPGNETFAKESHFFGGILGRDRAGPRSAALYRSFFPTIITRWWCEAVLGVPRWLCFDACPTSACLPYVAARAKAITPHAKLVVVVRDPVAGVFSAETMLRGMGVPLTWTLAQPGTGAAAAVGAAGEQQQQQDLEEGGDPRFRFSSLHDDFWQQLESLPVDAPLPADLPPCFYFHLHSYLQSGRYADRLAPWIKAFGRDRLLLVDFKEFCAEPEATVRRVMDFVGADSSRYTFKQQPPRMANDYKGARVDPGVAAYLRHVWFADSNAALATMMEQQQQQLGAGKKAPAGAAALA